jgi:galactokinase/mevalonate kinase-like predicted kinase
MQNLRQRFILLCELAQHAAANMVHRDQKSGVKDHKHRTSDALRGVIEHAFTSAKCLFYKVLDVFCSRHHRDAECL